MSLRDLKILSPLILVSTTLNLCVPLYAQSPDGFEYQFPSVSEPAKQRVGATNLRNQPDAGSAELAYPRAFSLPPVPGRKRRELATDRLSMPTSQGIMHRIGLVQADAVGYQTQQETEKSPLSPYDEVFLDLPPTPKSSETQRKEPSAPGSEYFSADQVGIDDSDDLLLSPPTQSGNDMPSPSDRNPNRWDAELEEFGSEKLRILENDHRTQVPYQAPDLKSRSELVVPLPVIPAPADFPGFLPQDPNANTLPEPRRTFELPKRELVSPAPVPSQDRSSVVMPWHSPEMYHEFAPQFHYEQHAQFPPSSHFVGHQRAGHQRANGHPGEFADRPTLRPQLATLPERLQSRHFEFKIQPYMPSSASPLPLMSDTACHVELQYSDFAPIPTTYKPLDAQREIDTYYGKSMVETQRPWVEWWRPFYTGGMYEPGIPVFSEVNLLTPSFLVYGDYRTAVGVHRFGGRPTRQWAHRLNLDMDLRLTGTERFHMFAGPLDDNGRFTRLDFSDSSNVEFEDELDFRPETAFFEGDLGAIAGSLQGVDAPFDLPFTLGIVPLLYQNGIWMEDAIVGFAFGSPWRHSRPFNWENFETTFFVGFNDITSPAFQDQDEARVFGTAWFIEAYGGYIEADYAYLDERQDLGRSYHNAAISFTRRYFGRISNSVRLIGKFF